MPCSCRVAHKGKELKHKIGEKTSHSYWSWTHGPRGTTHGTSGKRSWWCRSSRRSILPPQGAETGSSGLPILESPPWQNREEYCENRCLPRVSMMGGKYTPKGGTRGRP